MPRIRTQPAAAALTAGVMALALASCSTTTTIDQKKAEKLILDNVSGANVKPEKVDCPSDVEAKKGETFTCTVSYDNGTEGKATVHMTDDEGAVTIGDADIEQPK
jgi:hypothetical protein